MWTRGGQWAGQGRQLPVTVLLLVPDRPSSVSAPLRAPTSLPPPTHQGMVLSAEYIKKKLEQEMVLSQAFGRDLVRRVPRRGALAAPSPPAPQREIGERMEPPLRTRLPHFPWTPGSRHPHLLSSSCPL